jgi:hypothetical protein
MLTQPSVRRTHARSTDAQVHGRQNQATRISVDGMSFAKPGLNRLVPFQLTSGVQSCLMQNKFFALVF